MKKVLGILFILISAALTIVVIMVLPVVMQSLRSFINEPSANSGGYLLGQLIVQMILSSIIIAFIYLGFKWIGCPLRKKNKTQPTFPSRLHQDN